MRLMPIALVAAAAVSTVPFALADGQAPAGAAPVVTSADGCRVEVVPAHCAIVDRQVTVPAVTCVRHVPVMETVNVPIMEDRCVTDFRDEQVPVFATREVPAFEEKQVPEYGQVPVTVYETREKPVDLSLPNPFSCDCSRFNIHLWNKCEKVPCGTEMRPGIVGWHTERVACGTRTETFQTGTETRRVVAGTHVETVKVGDRPEQRLTGWRDEAVLVTPARTDTVRERVDVPAQAVTVTNGDPARATQLPGTSMVVTDAQYRYMLAQNR